MRPPPLTAGARIHEVTIEAATVGPDGSGNYVETWAPIAGPLWASIAPAVAADLERLTSATVMAVATHILRCPYVAGITTLARVRFGARLFSIAGVANVEERNVQLILFCVELEAGQAVA